MVKILYLGSFIHESIFEEVWKYSKGSMVFSGDKFQHSFLEGVLKYDGFIDKIIVSPAIGSYPFRYKKLIIKGFDFNYLKTSGYSSGFFNLIFFKRFSIFNSLKKSANYWVKVNHQHKKVIIVYSLLESYIKTAVDIKRKHKNVFICCIVLDLPKYFDESNKGIAKYINEKSTQRISSLISEVDSFILLTKAMSEELDLDKKPWLLLEGIYSPRSIPASPKESKTILYSGKLDLRFGIDHLVTAFCKINDPDAKLWICGDGSARKYVEEYARKDHRIIYFGVVKPDKAIELQHRANLLINPRKGDEEYTRFSFPSKTMEYLASGTPTIMYPLPGVPVEYFKYLVLVEDNSIETLSLTIKDWLSKTQQELDAFGLAAREFILNNKTTSNQAKRIFKFVQSIVN